MDEILAFVAEKMEGLNYEFERWSGKPQYPYWIGEYTEAPQLTEDGLTNVSFILTGTTRGSRIDLERDRAKIEKAFPKVSGAAKVANGCGIAAFYNGALTVPTDTDEIKRLQVNLDIRYWRA